MLSGCFLIWMPKLKMCSMGIEIKKKAESGLQHCGGVVRKSLDYNNKVVLLDFIFIHLRENVDD